MFIQATSSMYKAMDMCDSPAKDYGWIDPGMIHRVTLNKSVNEYLYTKITLYIVLSKNCWLAAVAKIIYYLLCFFQVYLCSLIPMY